MKPKLIATQSFTPITNQQKIETVPMIGNVAEFIIFFSIVSVIAVIIYDCLSKYRLHFFRLKLPRKTPCDRCQYLSCNSYLKCALHPSIVLTEQAIDCQDYHPNNKDKVW